ncbi:MAG: YbjN domain-containing protein, partial [Clostridia bacterium]|nr:YbjN domain-containing protein [Clostridia bacterium]
MADIIKSLAQKNYRTLLEAVEANNWICGQDDAALKIDYGVNGDYFKMKFIIKVEAEKQLVILNSELPCKFPREKSGIAAMVICTANYALADGRFDFNLDNGSISFKMTENYRGSLLSKEAFMYLLNYSVWAIDKFYKPINDVITGKRTPKDMSLIQI